MKQLHLPLPTRILIGILLVTGCCERVYGQSSDADQGQVMLLKNGAVLRGLIERTANHYRIHTRSGSRMDIPFEKVEFISDSLVEMYWRRLSRIGPNEVQGHENLFFWCLNQGLCDEANNQIEIFKAIGVDVKKVETFERRLAQTLQERTRIASPTTNATNSTVVDRLHQTVGKNAGSLERKSLTPIFNGAELNARQGKEAVVQADGDTDFFRQLEPVFRPLPSFTNPSDDQRSSQMALAHQSPGIGSSETEGQVIQVGYNEIAVDAESVEIAKDQPVVAQKPTLSPNSTSDLSARDLETFIKRLPKNSLARFRSRVEPVLISKCSDCHQRGSTEVSALLLMFRGKLQPLTIRMSERNLYAAAKYLNKNDVEASALLRAATTPHGGQQTPAVAMDSPEYKSLYDWVQLVVGEREQHEMGGMERTGGEMSQVGQPVNEHDLNALSQVNQPIKEPRKLDQSNSSNQPVEVKSSLAPGFVHPRSDAARSPNTTANPQRARMLAPLPPTIGEIPSLKESLNRYVPRDEFDPEIFNRQFRQAESGLQ